MPKKLVIGLTLGILVVAAAFIFFSSGNKYDATGKFSGLEIDKSISLNSIFSADTVCLIPNGIDPFTFLNQNFTGKGADRGYDYDSAYTWYVMAVNDRDNTARIMSVDRNRIPNDFQTVICSRKLTVAVKNKGNQRHISVFNDQRQ